MVDEEWHEDHENYSVKVAIAALRKSLLLPAAVKKALKNGESPLAISIEKWQRISNILAESSRLSTIVALEPFIGASTCGLCIQSIATYKAEKGELTDNMSKCEVCPLARIEKCPEEKSVYSQIDNIVSYAKNVPQFFADEADAYDQIKPLVTKMLKYLYSLQSA